MDNIDKEYNDIYVELSTVNKYMNNVKNKYNVVNGYIYTDIYT